MLGRDSKEAHQIEWGGESRESWCRAPTQARFPAISASPAHPPCGKGDAHPRRRRVHPGALCSRAFGCSVHFLKDAGVWDFAFFLHPRSCKNSLPSTVTGTNAAHENPLPPS